MVYKAHISHAKLICINVKIVIFRNPNNRMTVTIQKYLATTWVRYGDTTCFQPYSLLLQYCAILNTNSQAVSLRVFFFSFSQHGKGYASQFYRTYLKQHDLHKVDQQKHQLFNFIILAIQLVVCNWVLDCQRSHYGQL